MWVWYVLFILLCSCSTSTNIKINNTKNNAKKETNKANLTNNGYSKSAKSINGNSFNKLMYKKLFIPENIFINFL